MVVSPGPPAVIMRARRKVVGHLTGVGATNAGAAVTYLPTRRFERKALTDLQRRGVVSLADGGRYWVDEAKAAELQRATRTRFAVIAGGALAAAAAVFAFTR
jgi:hypothetical protein